MVGTGRSRGIRILLFVLTAILPLAGVAAAQEATDPKVAALLEKLRDKDLETRGSAANELATCGPAAAQALLNVLKSDDQELQGGAAMALARMGADASAILPGLVELIKEDKGQPKRKSMFILMVLGGMGTEAVPALVSLLDEGDESMQLRALSVLAQLGVNAKAALPAIARIAASSSSEHARSAAIRFLSQLGCAGVPDLLPIAESGSGQTRIAAIGAIGLALRRCRGAKDYEEPAAHSAMTAEELAAVNEALGEQGLDLQTVDDALLAMLDDPDEEVCQEAIRALVSLGTNNQRVATRLLGLLKTACDKTPHANESVPDAEWITSALSSLGAEAEPAILEALRQWEGRARCPLMKSLGRSSSQAAAHAVAGILEEVKGSIDATSVRLNEIAANPDTTLVDEDGDKPGWIELYNGGNKPVSLNGWGLTDDPQQPHKWLLPDITMEPHAFLVILASGKDRVPADGGRMHTNFILNPEGGYLGLFDASPTPKRSPGLEDGYEAVPQGSSYCYYDDDEETMETAVRTLGRLGQTAREAIPLLLGVSRDEIGYISEGALDAAVSIDPGAPEVVAAVVQTAMNASVASEQEEEQGEEQEVDAARDLHFSRTRMSSLEPRGSQALAALKPALQAPDAEIRRWAFTALEKASPDEAVVPLLVAALQSTDTALRCPAAAALGTRGPAAHDAVPALLLMAQSHDSSESKAAAIALVQIGEHVAEAGPVLLSALNEEQKARPREPGQEPDEMYMSSDALFEALGKLGSKTQEAIPALLAKAGTGGIRTEQLVKVLSGAGPDGVAPVLAMLHDTNAEPLKRCMMAETIAKLDGVSDKAVPALTECVKDSNRHVRACAIVGLGSLAEKAEAAVPALITASKEDSDWENRQRAALALSRIRPKEFQAPRNSECWERPSYPRPKLPEGMGPLGLE